MYVPRHFAIEDPAQLHAFMRAHPLATLVTAPHLLSPPLLK